MRPEDFDDGEPPVPGIELKGGDETLRRYAGKVIAVVDGEVRAAADTWGACIEAALKDHLPNPMFMLLPAGSIIGGLGI